MASLTCPRCAFVAEFPPGSNPVCPTCGYPGPDARMWSQPAPPSGSGKVVGIVLGVVGGIFLLTIILASVVFVLVQNLSHDASTAGGDSPFTVVGAAITPGQCGEAHAGLTCHALIVRVDNTNSTRSFGLYCCWSGEDAQGGIYEALPLEGEPDYLAAGKSRQVTIRFALADPNERLAQLRYMDYGSGESSAPVPPY